MLFSRVLVFSAALAVSALGLSGLVASPAAAVGLTGQSMSAGYYLPDTVTVYPFVVFSPSPAFVVGAGQETDGNVEDVTHLLVDFADDTLDITLTTVLSSPTWQTQVFNGLIFTSALPHDIATATVDGSTTMVGFDNTRISFTSNEILVNWSGLSYVNGTTLKINFTFAEPIPEPASGLLVGGGLLGLAFVRRKRA